MSMLIVLIHHSIAHSPRINMNMLTVLKRFKLKPDLKTKLVACFSAIFVCSAMAGVERPNILLIYTDD